MGEKMYQNLDSKRCIERVRNGNMPGSEGILVREVEGERDDAMAMIEPSTQIKIRPLRSLLPIDIRQGLFFRLNLDMHY